MTTRPSNQTHDEWSDVPTMAGGIPPTVASPAASEFDATAPTAARQYAPALAWSAEPSEFASPLPIERPRPWFMRSGVRTFVGGGLVAAAAAGLFVALYGAHSEPVDATTSHNAPASAAAPAPAPKRTDPVPTPAPQTKPTPTTHSVTASHGSSGSTSHQTPHQYTPPSSSSGQHTNDQSWQNTNDQQWQSDHDSVSTPPTWNLSDFYWLTHRRDDGSRWTHDRHSDNRSDGDHGDNSRSSHDQSSENHSTGSNDNGSK
jgi:hypothetical protein